METEKKYKCKNCNWVGTEQELVYDSVEGCFGTDEIEICPKCGSFEVFVSL